jgi:hypothetical protein
MSQRFARYLPLLLVIALALVCACATGPEPLLPAETFHWVSQPVTFSPPPARWYRQGDNGDGMLGVRFILRDGDGQAISILAGRRLADRDRREPLARLIARQDSLAQPELLQEIELAKARLDEPISDRESQAALAINSALSQARDHVVSGEKGFAASDLETAQRAADAYEPTFEELKPLLAFSIAKRQDPVRWILAAERDTTLAGYLVFVSEDTLLTDEGRRLYREILWVVHGCAFKAIFQGKAGSLPVFYRVVDSIRFPEASDAAH